MALTLRVIAALWGVFFGLLALRGILNPAVFTETFGLVAEGMARNTLRADYGSFFLVAAGAAFWGAAKPAQARVLWVPAALFGVALIGRLFGLASGDEGGPGITQAMVTEAVTAVFMLFAADYLPKSAAAVSGE